MDNNTKWQAEQARLAVLAVRKADDKFVALRDHVHTCRALGIPIDERFSQVGFDVGLTAEQIRDALRERPPIPEPAMASVATPETRAKPYESKPEPAFKRARKAAEPDGMPEPLDLAALGSRLGEAVTRLPTGIDSLDEALKGGIQTGRLLVVVAAPGMGKTGFLVQNAVSWARNGVHVGILTADEDADRVCSRLGQHVGIDREALEYRDPEDPSANDAARADFIEDVASLPIYLFDGSDSVDLVSLKLKELADGRPSVLIVDSLQTVRSVLTGDADGIRGRIDGVVAALKQAAKQDSHAVLATSESSRAGYRSRVAGDNASALSQAKESGSVEYASDVLLAFSPVKGSISKVDVEIAKNRIGDKGRFRLEWQSHLCGFREVDLDDDDVDRDEAKLEAAKTRVLKAITMNPGSTKRAICALAKGNRQDNLDAVDVLLLEGAIANRGKGHAHEYWPTDSQPAID